MVDEVFAVDAALDPCLTLAARHRVVCRTVQQLLHDATHQGFEVLQADIVDPSWWVATNTWPLVFLDGLLFTLRVFFRGWVEERHPYG